MGIGTPCLEWIASDHSIHSDGASQFKTGTAIYITAPEILGRSGICRSRYAHAGGAKTLGWISSAVSGSWTLHTTSSLESTHFRDCPDSADALLGLVRAAVNLRSLH